MKFGLTLSNRGVLVGLTTPRALLHLADAVEASPLMDSVWCGDALFVNRRLDALTLLAAVAGRTERVLLGPACMGSFALRNPMVLAYEWASLDVLSGGRTRMVACSGGGAGPVWEAETKAMGFNAEDRHKMMVEAMAVMRHLWTSDDEPFKGQFWNFEGLTLEPKPAQSPCPIWMATNPGRQVRGEVDMAGSDFALKRVGRIADGWMTHSVSREGFTRSWAMILGAAAAAGRDTSNFDHVLYHHINVGEDEEACLADSKTFLDLYYGANYTRERLEGWLTHGPPQRCIEDLRRWKEAGCRRITFRLSTMGDPIAQLRRVTEEVLPFV
jgi:alkanesulfonate monooxygenase SsuD/methylene tetrahydromethanopterin reductase-like flavin-dependent oxidoreductase (luciferase family)